MELVSPPVSAIIWQVVMVFHVILFMTAWTMLLRNSRLNAPYTLVWMLGTLLLPVLGPVIFFMRRRSFN